MSIEKFFPDLAIRQRLYSGPLAVHIDAFAERLTTQGYTASAARERLRLIADLSRVLSHVPVKGRHHVRYYGLYVPGAQTKRDAVRRELGEEPEHTHEAEKEARYCPECGQALFHHKSTRGKFSYIKSIGPVQGQGYMQQDVQVDRESGPWCIEHYAERPPLGFFGSSGGNLT